MMVAAFDIDLLTCGVSPYFKSDNIFMYGHPLNAYRRLTAKEDAHVEMKTITRPFK